MIVNMPEILVLIKLTPVTKASFILFIRFLTKVTAGLKAFCIAFVIEPKILLIFAIPLLTLVVIPSIIASPICQEIAIIDYESLFIISAIFIYVSTIHFPASIKGFAINSAPVFTLSKSSVKKSPI